MIYSSVHDDQAQEYINCHFIELFHEVHIPTEDLQIRCH